MRSPASVPPEPASLRFLVRVGVKALLLFTGLNLLWALFNPLPLLARLTLYNSIFPGRERLPYGEDPSASYNLSLFSLEAMFASHRVNRPKMPDEFRVLLIGDSAAWGWRLRPEETLAEQINAGGYLAGDGRRVVAYNLGYPVLSLTKDLLILQRALDHQPDMIVWMVTLESFPADKQLFPPLVQHNAAPLRALINQFDLGLDANDPALFTPGPWARTLIGQRRDIADVLRLQAFGVLWAATGIDQSIPASYTPRQEDFEADPDFHGLAGPRLAETDIALDVLEAGLSLAGQTTLVVVNEPMFVSRGRNSDIRYNFFYPRWAYDDYRALLRSRAEARGWNYLDLWDVVDMGEYTDSAIHLTPTGEGSLAQVLGGSLAVYSRPSP